MKFMIVINRDRDERSVHLIENESTAQDVIAAEQKKGRKITGLTCDAPDMDAAAREAERIEPNYHHVENALAD